ncbi:MAG: class I SAM-dependent methyltransferase [Pseudomonadota bacterium]
MIDLCCIIPVFNEDARDDVVWGGPKRAEGANPERPNLDYGYDTAQVNHYALRSLDAFIFKKFRGRANHMDQDLGLHYWQRWNMKGDLDRSMLALAEDVKSAIATLCEDPILEHLNLAAQAWHKEKFENLLADPEYQSLHSEIMELEKISAVSSDKPRRHANRMRLLESMPVEGKCAEIGVWNGGFSENILRITRPSELVLIDPWDLVIETVDDTKTHAKHSDGEAMRTMFDHVTGLFQDQGNVTVKRGFSADILAEFPDDYFDWVYIDGNHLYDFVYRDIELSFAKVKPGGIIAGDDFFWKRDGRMHVREAVLDAMKAHGIGKRPKRFGQQFMITVP